MVTITIQTEDQVLSALKELAQQQQTTPEIIAQRALTQYLASQIGLPAPYSFIGIAHSGQKDLSTKVETILHESASRYEGWSLDE